MRNSDYLIRVPILMHQTTDVDGFVLPESFDWEQDDGSVERLVIERVRDIVPFAEQKSGVVGDRYEVVINGQLEYLYYGKLQPRTWYKLREVDAAEWREWYAM